MKKASLILGLFSIFGLLTGQGITIDRQVNMLALGDSYTIGESVDTFERWPHQFIDELRKLGVRADYPDYIAATGWTTRRLLQGMRFQLDKDQDYNLVSILIGVNNQYQGIDIESYEPDLRTIIDQALEIVNQDISRVFIVSIPDYAYTPFGGGGEVISQEIDEYNAIKRSVAAEYGISFIDITPISRNGLNNPSLVAGDGLHPSGLQYQQWVQAIMSRINLDPALSVKDAILITPDSFKIFPNPGHSTLQIESLVNLGLIRIFNMLGMMVYELKTSDLNVKINVSHLAPGTYSLWILPAVKHAGIYRTNLIIQPV